MSRTPHAYSLEEFRHLPHERDREIGKVKRVPPTSVFTKSGSEGAARRAFPQVMNLVSREYRVAGWIDEGDRFSSLVRNDRLPVCDYGGDRWPCYR